MVVNKYDYQAFGEAYNGNTTATNTDMGTATTIDNRYTYTGREKNPVSGTMYYRTRAQYNPYIGIFTNRNPWGYIQERLSLYDYVGNNPINFSEPFSHRGNPYKQLTWDDFRGNVPEGAEFDAEIYYTTPSITSYGTQPKSNNVCKKVKDELCKDKEWCHYDKNPEWKKGSQKRKWIMVTEKATDEDIKGKGCWECTYSLPGVVVNVEQDPTISWVKNDKKSDYLLKHEQGHFDIAHVYAKAYQARIRSVSHTEIRCSKACAFKYARDGWFKKINAIFEKYVKASEEQENKYESETDHSKDSTKQEAWNLKISGWLNNASSAPMGN